MNEIPNNDAAPMTATEAPSATATVEGLSSAVCSALPVEAGFYWWRKYPDQEWRMVHIVDFAAGYPNEKPYLAAYDIEYRAWSGRTLRIWAIHDPIGQWMPCSKPNS